MSDIMVNEDNNNIININLDSVNHVDSEERSGRL